MIKLTITEKGGEPRSLTFDKDEISIGRVSGNDIVLPKGNISKRHSRLVVKDGALELVDLKSTNGTYVNGRKIGEPATISGADRIQVGDFLITLQGEGGDAAARSGPVSSSRPLPVPPPPPPPARHGSGLSGLPALPGETGASSDEGDSNFGMKSRSGRVPIPPPPPPPPRRTTAQSAPLGLEDDGVDIGGDVGPPSPSDIASSEEDLAASGPALFEGSRNAAFDDASRPMGDQTGEHLPLEGMDGGASAEDDAPGIDLPDGGGLTGPVASGGDEPALDQLDVLVNDPTVTQIIIGGPDIVLVERGGKLEAIPGGLGDANTVAETLWRLANTAVPPPPPDNPVVDVRLPDGTRLAAVFPPAAVAGVCGSIRKASLPMHSLAELGAAGGLAKEAQTVIEAALAAQRNLLVTGDAGSVATLLGAIAGALPSGRRVVSLGANAGQARPGWTELAPVGDLPGLIRVAAALRADHLLVGEVMGPEVLDLLLAASHGQEGIILGLTARSASEGLARLEALTGQVSGAHGVASLANSTLDLVLHVTALTDGGLRITEVTEVKVDNANRLVVDPVLSWRSEGSRRGPAGKMQIIGVSSRLAAAMAGGGGTLPSNLIRK